MAFLDTKHQRAALVIIALGAVVLWSLGPYATGIIGIPVLAVLFAPLQDWLVKRGAHTGLASLAVTLLGAVLLIVPGLVLAGLLINEAQQVAASVLRVALARSDLIGTAAD